MVLLSSRLGLDPAAAPCSTGKRLHRYAAPLLPKVRGQFAEFLSEGSLVHLSLLNLPTCVGMRYGQTSFSLAVFRASVGSIRSVAARAATSSSPLGQRHSGFAYRGSLPASTALVSPPNLPSWRPLQSNEVVWFRSVYRMSIGPRLAAWP